MPIPYKAYGCKFKCGCHHRESFKEMEGHEKQCWYNPEVKRCATIILMYNPITTNAITYSFVNDSLTKELQLSGGSLLLNFALGIGRPVNGSIMQLIYRNDTFYIYDDGKLVKEITLTAFKALISATVTDIDDYVVNFGFVLHLNYQSGCYLNCSLAWD